MALTPRKGGCEEPRVLGASGSHHSLAGILKPYLQAVTNTLFQTHLDHRIKTRLPPAPPSDAAAEVLTAYNEAKDQVLTEFYRDWLEANKERQARWIWEWWVDVRDEVFDGLRRTMRWR
jgi:hypothetical protein